ncbi:MAG: VOC family protein [Oscillospiraceae bacterium]|nr:VOC family protein [Oscillospiraceae bacterium]
MNVSYMAVVLDSANSDALSAFYANMLGWERIKPDDEWIIVYNNESRNFPLITFQQIENYERPKWPAEKGKQQQMVHLDFHVDDVDEAVKHAISCGAVLSDIQLEDAWRVMLDPAGHPFCILPVHSA